MKINDPVTYCDHVGEHSAFVTGVVGSGASTFKMLDVALTDGRTYRNVPHEKDAEQGRGYWRQGDPQEAAPGHYEGEPWKPEEAPPVEEPGTTDEAGEDEVESEEEPPNRRRGRGKGGR